MRRALLLLAAALLVGGALYWILLPAPVAVETATVTRGPFVATVEEDGRTRVRDRYVVSAPVAGRVLRIAARPGDAVAPGEGVATILAAPSTLLSPRARREAEERVGAAEASLEQATALVERAAAQLGQAEADAVRIRALQARGAVSVQQLERAELAVQTATRDVQAAERRAHAAEHELAQARAVLQTPDASHEVRERRTIQAPAGGRVLRVLQESEAVVASGAPLLEIGDPADLEVIVDVLTTEAVGIRPGAPATIERWGGTEPLEGRVRLIEPGAFTRVSALGVEEQRVWVVIDLITPPARRAALGDGFRVDARITVEEIADALRIPISALFRGRGGWAVFAVQEGVARERSVEVARRGRTVAAIAAGLSQGDLVVLYPPSTLRDGRAVRNRP